MSDAGFLRVAEVCSWLSVPLPWGPSGGMTSNGSTRSFPGKIESASHVQHGIVEMSLSPLLEKKCALHQCPVPVYVLK